jgi:hypothetical protein
LILNSIDNILLAIIDCLSYNLLILPTIAIFLITKAKLGNTIKNLRTPNQSIKKARNQLRL